METFNRFRVLSQFHVGLAKGVSGQGSSETIVVPVGTILDFDGSVVVIRDSAGKAKSHFEKPELARLFQNPGFVEYLGPGQGPPEAPNLQEMLANFLAQQGVATSTPVPVPPPASASIPVSTRPAALDLQGLIAAASAKIRPEVAPGANEVQMGTKSVPVIRDQQEIPIRRMSVSATPSEVTARAQVGAVQEIVTDTASVTISTGKKFPIVRDEGGAVGKVITKVATGQQQPSPTQGQAQVGQPSIQTSVRVGPMDIQQGGMTLKTPTNSPVMSPPVETTTFRRQVVREDGTQIDLPRASSAPSAQTVVTQAKPRLTVDQVKQIVPGFEWDLSLPTADRIQGAMKWPVGSPYLKAILRVEDPQVVEQIQQTLAGLDSL
jgi:hypothetical protein